MNILNVKIIPGVENSLAVLLSAEEVDWSTECTVARSLLTLSLGVAGLPGAHAVG